jgi:hypothetical protein
MTGLLDRAAGYFLAPAGTKPAAGASLPPTTRAVVIGTHQDAPPIAAALALTLRAAVRAPAALVAVWRAEGNGDGPLAVGAATPSASRLAARLTRRGHLAAARGRLAWLDLPTDPETTALGLRRAQAAVDVPAVTALAGPRPEALEELIEEHDLAVVAADPDTPLARAALACLGDRCVSALACRPLARGVPRALALAGLLTPRLDPPLTLASPHGVCRR